MAAASATEGKLFVFGTKGAASDDNDKVESARALGRTAESCAGDGQDDDWRRAAGTKGFAAADRLAFSRACTHGCDDKEMTGLEFSIQDRGQRTRLPNSEEIIVFVVVVNTLLE